MNIDIIQAGASIIAAIVAVIAYLRLRRSYGLRWVVLPPKSMMEIAEDIASSISILYEQQKIDNLLRFQFILHNTGSAPLKMRHIESPLTWEAPGKIVKHQVLETDPPGTAIDLKKTGKSDNRLVVRWKIFNQGCKAVIEVICEGKMTDGWQNANKITSQIEHIPEVKVKRIMWQQWQWLEPDEVIRRTKVNFPEKPRLQKRLILCMRFIVPKMHAFFCTYLLGMIAFLPTLGLFLEMIETKNSITATAFVLVVVAEIIIVLWLWRTPYSSIIWKAHQKRQSGSI